MELTKSCVNKLTNYVIVLKHKNFLIRKLVHHRSIAKNNNSAIAFFIDDDLRLVVMTS